MPISLTTVVLILRGLNLNVVPEMENLNRFAGERCHDTCIVAHLRGKAEHA